MNSLPSQVNHNSRIGIFDCPLLFNCVSCHGRTIDNRYALLANLAFGESPDGSNLTCSELENYVTNSGSVYIRMVERASYEPIDPPGGILLRKPRRTNLIQVLMSSLQVCRAAKAGIAFGVIAW